jgi:hypothetical protein
MHMKLRVFICMNEAWLKKDSVLTLEDARALAVFHGLDPMKVQRRHVSKRLGFYYGKTCIAEARILGGQLRCDAACSSYGQPVLVLENGTALNPEDLDAYQVVHATGKEMAWAAGISGKVELPVEEEAGRGGSYGENEGER